MNIEEYNYNLIKNFIVKFPELYENMKDSEHGDIDNGYFPDYHLGESVWTHTLMVVSHMVIQLKDTVSSRGKELLLAALLHDIGKPQARFFNKEKEKIVFYGHDSISTFLALDIIQEIDPTITEEQKLYTLKLINYHQILFDVTKDMTNKAVQKLANKFNDEKLFADLIILRYCDFSGNISKSTQSTSWNKTCEIMDLIKTHPIEENKPTVTLMVGLPASGKSTYIKENWGERNILSRDALLMSIANISSKFPVDYSTAFRTVDQKEVDKLHEEELRIRLKSKISFVIDRTNLTHKGRMKFINRARQAGFSIKIIVFLVDMQTIIDRNAQRTFFENKDIPIEVIKKMMKNFNIPFANEGEVEYIFI